MEKYDYIICGAGLAGLSLAYRFCSPEFASKRILLIEKEEKLKNDRTFCHWAIEDGPYEDIVSQKWNYLEFKSLSLQKKFDISPYQYKMIRGDDFYAFNLKKIRNSKHVTLIREKILQINEAEICSVKTEDNIYTSDHVFKTFQDTKLDFSKSQYVSQHFMGWVIKTEGDMFTESSATFMDFNIPQKDETRFMYVLPTDTRHALVELAIFSNALLSVNEYEEVLKNYIEEHLDIQVYSIEEKERGVIPMTTYAFEKHDTNKISHIGTASGAVKPSSGYAFARIQEHTDLICKLILEGNHPNEAQRLFKSKYKRYDRTFLNAILSGKTNGEHVFSLMFRKLPPQLIFKFLDEKTSLFEELKVFTAPPMLPFIKAFLEEL